MMWILAVLLQVRKGSSALLGWLGQGWQRGAAVPGVPPALSIADKHEPALSPLCERGPKMHSQDLNPSWAPSGSPRGQSHRMPTPPFLEDAPLSDSLQQVCPLELALSHEPQCSDTP